MGFSVFLCFSHSWRSSAVWLTGLEGWEIHSQQGVYSLKGEANPFRSIFEQCKRILRPRMPLATSSENTFGMDVANF